MASLVCPLPSILYWSRAKQEEGIEKILKHLGLWDLKVRPPPEGKVPSLSIPIADSDSEVPLSAPSFYPDSDYPMDSYRISKPHRVTPMFAIFALHEACSKPKKLTV